MSTSRTGAWGPLQKVMPIKMYLSPSSPDAAVTLLRRVTGGQEVAAEQGLVPGEPLALGALAAVLLAVGRVLSDQVTHQVVLLDGT